MMEGAQHTSNVSSSKKHFNVMGNTSSLEKLYQLSQLLPNEDRRAFSNKYGSVLDLLLISVETSALNILAQYWSPALRCFELPNIDITPTIEEYACMLKLPVKRNNSIYFRLEQHTSDAKIIEQFRELLGVPVARVKLTGHADSKGVTKAFVEDRLKDLGHKKEWTTFSRVLAFAIYGLVLFPSAPDIIDQAATHVFFAVENK